MSRLVVLAFSLVFASSCQQVWYFSSTGVDDSGNPIFCASTKPRCAGSGVRLSDLRVFAVDDGGKRTTVPDEEEVMWAISPAQDVALNRFTYGEAPFGWQEMSSSKALSIGQWYSIGSHFFRMTRTEGEVSVETVSNEEFFTRLQGS